MELIYIPTEFSIILLLDGKCSTGIQNSALGQTCRHPGCCRGSYTSALYCLHSKYIYIFYPFSVCLQGPPASLKERKLQIHGNQGSRVWKGVGEAAQEDKENQRLWIHSQLMLKCFHLQPIPVPRTHWVVRAGMGELPQIIGEGKLGRHHITTTSSLWWQKLMRWSGRAWGKEDVPGDTQSCECPSHHPISRPLRRVITSNLVSCMSAERLQSSAGQRQGRAGSAGTCQGVTSSVAHSVRGWQQFAFAIAGPIIPQFQGHAPASLPLSSPTCPSHRDH